MTIQELERQLLTLDRNERIRIIQVMAQSLAIHSQEPRIPNLDQTSIGRLLPQLSPCRSYQ